MELDSPDDVSGLKISDIGIGAEILKELGATPVTVTIYLRILFLLLKNGGDIFLNAISNYLPTYG
jgi:hypothetical protein